MFLYAERRINYPSQLKQLIGRPIAGEARLRAFRRVASRKDPAAARGLKRSHVLFPPEKKDERIFRPGRHFISRIRVRAAFSLSSIRLLR